MDRPKTLRDDKKLNLFFTPNTNPEHTNNMTPEEHNEPTTAELLRIKTDRIRTALDAYEKEQTTETVCAFAEAVYPFLTENLGCLALLYTPSDVVDNFEHKNLTEKEAADINGGMNMSDYVFDSINDAYREHVSHYLENERPLTAGQEDSANE